MALESGTNFKNQKKSEEWGISEEDIEKWKNSIDDAEINPSYRQQHIKPVYSLKHYKDNRKRYQNFTLRVLHLTMLHSLCTLAQKI